MHRAVLVGGVFQSGLAVGEYVHLNGLDRLGFAMNHAPNAFGGLSAEYWFAAVEADSSWDLLNSGGSAIDIKHLAHQFLTALGFPAHMTAKHSHLRRE